MGLFPKTRVVVKDEDLVFFRGFGDCQRRGFGIFPKTRIWGFVKDEDLGFFQRRGFRVNPHLSSGGLNILRSQHVFMLEQVFEMSYNHQL